MSTKLVNLRADRAKKFLLPLGDIHWGHPNCDQDKVRGYLEWAKREDAWILLMGDLIENNNKGSVGAGVYEQTMPPDDQIDEILELLGPHTDRIVGLLTGNHEERSFKDNGIDPSKYMARVLGVPYLRYAGFLRTVVGRHTYITYATHGGSGSATVAGKLNAVKKLSGVAQADVYLMGHMHDLIESTSTVRTVDSRNRTVRDARQHFVVTGSFLGYEDSYSEMKNYSPPKLGAPRVRFDGVEKAVHVSI